MKLYEKHPKRRGGDRYAGLFDLLAPYYILGVVLFSCALGVLVWIRAFQGKTTGGPLFLLPIVAMALPYLVQRFLFAVRVVKCTHRPALLPFGLAVLTLRDIARVLGASRAFSPFGRPRP